MYELNVNGTIYTCPKTSLIPLALQKAIESKRNLGEIRTTEQAINVFKKFGIEVKECVTR